MLPTIRTEPFRYDQKGDHAKAEEGLKKYLDVRPYDSRALSMLASNYEKQERYDDAQQIYSNLAEKHSENPSYKRKLENVNKMIPVAPSQAPTLESALAQDSGEELASIPAENREKTFDVEVEDVPELEPEEVPEETEELTLGYNLEDLTQNDENVSPFEKQLDDEIEASRSDDNSLDALISEEDKLDQIEDEADFFKDNPFGSSPAPQRARPEEEDRMFQTEDLDDGVDKSNPVGLDEDIQLDEDDDDDDEMGGFQLDGDADVESLPEPEEVAEPEVEELEPVSEPEEVVEPEVEEFEPVSEPEEVSEPEVEELEPVSEPEEIAEPEDDEVETLLEPTMEEVVEPEIEESEGLSEEPEMEEEAEPEPLMEEAESLPEPEELELDPEDMDEAGDVSQELPVDVPQPEDAIEEADVVEDVSESSPLPEDFFDDVEDELSMELSEIEDAITDRSTAEKYKPVANMLRQLRNLADFLPPDKKAEFMQGEIRLKMEWAISRLEGKPGLMAVSEAWRKDFDLEKPFSEPEVAKEFHGVKLAGFVMDYMKNIIGSLDDVYLAASLGSKVENLISKLKS